MDNMSKEDQIAASYEHSQWIDGLQQYAADHVDEATALSARTERILTTVDQTAMMNLGIISPVLAIANASGVALVIGYYLGKHGIDAEPPRISKELLINKVQPLITPGCDCAACVAKRRLLKDYGIDVDDAPNSPTSPTEDGFLDMLLKDIDLGEQADSEEGN